MKKSDIAMIILIASVSVLAAYFAANALLGGSKNRSATVKTIDPITSNVTQPDPAVFNKKAINPTVEVIIGGNGQSQGNE